MQIFNLAEITKALDGIGPAEIIRSIEEGFVAYSAGKVVVPPVGELIFEQPPGETHIKYGYIKGDDFYVIKIASGFYENPRLGLPASSGLMLLFSQKTGGLISILLDEGHLTQVRTAAAGAVAATHFAPRRVRRVGVLGAGVQGRMQVEYLRHVRPFEDVTIWGTSPEELSRYKSDMEGKGFRVTTTLNAADVASTCDLIVTATPSCKPLLAAGQIRKGTHITAMGSDTPEKQELDPAILKNADRVVVDSISQAMLRGEAFRAMQAGAIDKSRLVELGTAIPRPDLRRRSEDEITVVDLTGVAVQDIQITKVVWKRTCEDQK